MKNIKINEGTYERLKEIKIVDRYKSISAVIDDLITLVPSVGVSIMEAPAWEWKVGFIDNHTPDETLSVSWEELHKSDVGDEWVLDGSWDNYRAKVLFKDEKGVLIRFGIGRYDEDMIYHTEYYHYVSRME